MPKTKTCRACERVLPTDAFYARADSKDGHENTCSRCRDQRSADTKRNKLTKHDRARHHAQKQANARAADEADERARRLASDSELLTPADMLDDEYDVGVGNVDTPSARRASGRASKEKRQEFNARMGETAESVRRAAASAHRRGGDVLSGMTARDGEYVGGLAEQERRFQNRRLARSISLAAANEALNLAAYKQIAERYFRNRIVATGYAKCRPSKPAQRTVVLLLSDLHLGSELDSLDEPVPFRAIQEARRLEYVMRQAIDYKPQYRKNTKLVVLWNGDLIEGQLGHQIGAGAPLAEQKAICWTYARRMCAEFARAFPAVEHHWQPGNHGRDKVRHPGRATWRKWDGHEFEIGWALREMCSGLKNTTWHNPLHAVSRVDLHGSSLLLTHGDTELALKSPDAGSRQNAMAVAELNASRLWGEKPFDAGAFGHFHAGRVLYQRVPLIFNGALLPPNGHARANSWVTDSMGQFLWESVEGYPVGDLRFIQLGKAQDEDEALGKIIQPFRFAEER